MSLVRFQSLCLRSLPAATLNCQQIRVQMSRKALLLMKTSIDSEAVDGLMEAVLFDLDAKEMNPQTRFNKKKFFFLKKKKPKTQHKKGGKSTLTLSYVCYSTWTKRQFYKPMAIKILAKFHSARS